MHNKLYKLLSFIHSGVPILVNYEKWDW